MNDEDIKILENLIKKCDKCNLNECINCEICYTQVQSIKKIYLSFKKLKEENENLISDNLEYQRTQDIFDERTYRKKYLEERRKEEPNLLYPDADEIFERYYNQKTVIENLKEIEQEHKKENGELREKVKKLEENTILKEDLHEMTVSNNHKKENWVHRSILNSYIPVSKIKEKYEKNKARTDCRYCNNACDSYAVCMFCKELLEGK